MVKISVNRYVSTRIENIKEEVEAETQRLRQKALDRLEEIFKAAAKVARGQVTHQRINGKMTAITLNQRRRWVRVAEQVAKTMNSIRSNLDEKEIHTQLNELQRLVNETQTADQPEQKSNESLYATTLLIDQTLFSFLVAPRSYD